MQTLNRLFMQAHAKFTTIAWHRLLRSGDWGMLGVSALLVGGLFSQFWSKQVADVVVVRAGGKVVAELPLRHNRLLAVRGALGETLVEVRQGRVRIARDPSPKQYCVRQGWLTHPGETALCLPNQTSISIPSPHPSFDTVGY